MEESSNFIENFQKKKDLQIRKNMMTWSIYNQEDIVNIYVYEDPKTGEKSKNKTDCHTPILEKQECRYRIKLSSKQ
jgi:hypothetical protein